jgi:hypothetical protein
MARYLLTLPVQPVPPVQSPAANLVVELPATVMVVGLPLAPMLAKAWASPRPP